MDNPRAEKVAVVDEVRQHLNDADAALLTEYRGLKVKDLAGLRRTVRSSGGEYKIYKNTLVRLAAKEAGLDELESMLTGPTGITFIKGDAAAVAKALRDFSRTNPLLVLKGGILGDKVIGAKETAALADLPSRDVLLAQLAGLMAAPLQQFAGLLQALPRNLAFGLAALRDQRIAGGESLPVDEAPVDGAPVDEAPAPAAADEAPAPAAADEAPADTESTDPESTPSE